MNSGGAGPLMYHLSGNVISATVGLVYINLQPKYKLPSSTILGQFRKFRKLGVGAPFFQPHLKKTLCLGPEFLFLAIYASDLTFPALLISET